MPHHYHHTQIGYLIIAVFVFFCIFLVLLMVYHGFNWIGFIVLIFLAICLALFATLTVSIDNDALEIRFGIGLIRKRFSLKDIVSCQVVKNPWYYGWGVRLTPHGWLYNVSGFDAVEITMRDGKKYRIGTDVQKELEQAIRRALEGR